MQDTLPLSQPVAAASACSDRAAPRWLNRATLASLGVILLAGLLIRGILLWRFAGVELAVWDERDYDALAVNLVEHGQFGFTKDEPTSIRPPLYPALVAGIYRTCGVYNHSVVRAIQLLLSLATTGLVFLIARNLYNEQIGLVAAGVFCFNPSLLGAGNLILTETLFTFLVCSFVLLVERYLSSGRIALIVAAGGVLGLAALTRSVLWLFPPVLVVFLLAFDRERSLPMRALAAATALAAFCVVLAPWTIRNSRLQETFTTVDVMGGRNFMMGNYEYTPAYRPWAAVEIEGPESWNEVLSRHHGGLKDRTQGQIDKLAMRYAIGYVLAHPIQSAERSAGKFFHFWQLERELIAGARQGFWGSFSKPSLVLLAAVVLGAYALTMLAAVYGMFLAAPTERSRQVFLLLLVGFICGIHCLAFAHSRYHLPIMPIMMVYAAAAWCRRRELSGAWRSWSFAGATLVCLVLVGSWFWDVVSELHRL